MMVAVICDYCKKEMSITFRQVTATLELKSIVYCEHCKEMPERGIELAFCSPGCLSDYVQNGGLDESLKLFKEELEDA
jgi:hypothetical protein